MLLKGRIAKNLLFSKWPSRSGFLKLVLLLSILVFNYWNCLRVGSFWDYQGDDIAARANLHWLRVGVSQENEDFFQRMIPFGYSLTYIQWIPWLFGERNVDILSVQTEYWLNYRNIFTFHIFLFGVAAIISWSRRFLKFSPLTLFILILILFPPITGLAIMDDKDIPLFSGIASAMALMASVLKPQSTRVDFFLRILWLNASVLFVLGTRPGAAGILIGIYIYIFALTSRKVHFLSTLLWCLPTLIYIYLTSVTFQRFGILWLWKTFAQSSSFPDWKGKELYWGTVVSSPPTPWHYLHGHLFSQVPVFVFFLTVVLAIFWVKRTIQSRRYISISKRAFFRISINPKYFPALFLASFLGYVGISAPLLYNSARQLSFIWVFIIMIALQLLQKFLESFTNKAFRLALMILMTLPVIDNLKLAPYGYVYRNEIASAAAGSGFETDYWGLSGKEAVTWIEKSRNLPERLIGDPIVTYQVYYPKVEQNIEGKEITEPFIYAHINAPFNDFKNEYRSCSLLKSIERQQLTRGKVVLSYIRLCKSSQGN
jgi:hypothetical protein